MLTDRTPPGGGPAQVTVNCRTPEIEKKDLKVSRCEQLSPVIFLSMVPPGEVRRLFCGRVNQLLLTREDPGGHHMQSLTLKQAREREMFGACIFWRAVNPKDA